MDDKVENPKSQIPISKIPMALVGWIGLGAVLLGFGIWVLGFYSMREDEVWARIQTERVLRVATDASYPPFSAVSVEGEVFGFEVDLAHALGAHWGVDVAFENITFDALLGAVISKRDDVAISALVPQPGKLDEVAFTRPYFVGGQVVVIRAEDGGRWKPDEYGVWASGLTLCVEYGSGGDALARRWARGVANVTLLPKPTALEALEALAANACHAAIIEAVTAYDFLIGHPALVLSGPTFAPEPYTIAVNVHSSRLFAELETALQALEADGTLPALRRKWGLEIEN